jgi:hypothetical protein
MSYSEVLLVWRLNSTAAPLLFAETPALRFKIAQKTACISHKDIA